MNGGLDINFVKQCIESCNSCSSHGTKCKMQVWHEKHVCHINEVQSKLDDICKVHIVVRATRTKAVVGSNQVTYFKCHRGGKKRKKINPSGKKDAQCSTNARRERISRLCGCEFLIKTIVPLSCEKKKNGEFTLEATILVHNVHTGHDTRSNNDKYFLPVHPMVVKRAMEDLKRLISTSAVAFASLKDEDKTRALVNDLERSIYRFVLIPKQVEQLSYTMRLNGKNCFASNSKL
jgi:hypothetical protein